MIMKFYALTVMFTLLGTILGVGIHSMFQTAEATGGAGEIKGLIDPMIDRAIEALQNNNTELALEEIQTL